MAKLAGLPDSVIERAKEIVEQLLANDITETVKIFQWKQVQKNTAGSKDLDEVDMTQISLLIR